MRPLILSTLLVAVIGLAGPAAATPHVQPISQDTAKAFCSSNGQSFSNGGCSFCDPKHCHVIDCNTKGCFNYVARDGQKPVGPKPGGPVVKPGRPIFATGTRKSGVGPGTGVVPLSHPVFSGGGRRR